MPFPQAGSLSRQIGRNITPSSASAARRYNLHPSVTSMRHFPVIRESRQPLPTSTSIRNAPLSRGYPFNTVLRPLATAINRAMAAETAVKNFFSSPHFAVVGASSDPSKFGHKIFRWYTEHNLDVVPINPSSASITANNKAYDTVPNLSALPNPTETSVSIITPPKITMKVLEEAKKIGVEAVWLQPGTYNDEILEFAKKEFKAGVGGMGGGGGEGWCVLVDGDYGLEKAGKGKL